MTFYILTATISPGSKRTGVRWEEIITCTTKKHLRIENSDRLGAMYSESFLFSCFFVKPKECQVPTVVFTKSMRMNRPLKETQNDLLCDNFGSRVAEF